MYRRDVENEGDSGGRRKKRRQENEGSVNVDPGHPKNRKEAEREALGAESINKSCGEGTLPWSRPIKRFS